MKREMTTWDPSARVEDPDWGGFPISKTIMLQLRKGYSAIQKNDPLELQRVYDETVKFGFITAHTLQMRSEILEWMVSMRWMECAKCLGRELIVANIVRPIHAN